MSRIHPPLQLDLIVAAGRHKLQMPHNVRTRPGDDDASGVDVAVELGLGVFSLFEQRAQCGAVAVVPVELHRGRSRTAQPEVSGRTSTGSGSRPYTHGANTTPPTSGSWKVTALFAAQYGCGAWVGLNPCSISGAVAAVTASSLSR